MSTLDGFDVSTGSEVDLGGGTYVLTSMYVGLSSSSLALFSSTALPELGALAPEVALFDLYRGFMFRQNIYSPTLIGCVEIDGVVTGVAEPWAVPEPSTALLLGSGLLGAVGLRRCRALRSRARARGRGRRPGAHR